MAAVPQWYPDWLETPCSEELSATIQSIWKHQVRLPLLSPQCYRSLRLLWHPLWVSLNSQLSQSKCRTIFPYFNCAGEWTWRREISHRAVFKASGDDIIALGWRKLISNMIRYVDKNLKFKDEWPCRDGDLLQGLIFLGRVRRIWRLPKLCQNPVSIPTKNALQFYCKAFSFNYNGFS